MRGIYKIGDQDTLVRSQCPVIQFVRKRKLTTSSWTWQTFEPSRVGVHLTDLLHDAPACMG